MTNEPRDLSPEAMLDRLIKRAEDAEQQRDQLILTVEMLKEELSVLQKGWHDGDYALLETAMEARRFAEKFRNDIWSGAVEIGFWETLPWDGEDK